MVASYWELAKGLLENVAGVCLLDEELCSLGHSGTVDLASLHRWMQALSRSGRPFDGPRLAPLGRGRCAIVIPLHESAGRLLGAFCVQQDCRGIPSAANRYAEDAARRLKPLIDCVHRELLSSLAQPARLKTLTDRTTELEWLFKVTENLQTSRDDRHVIEELLDETARRLGSALAVLHIPGKRLCVERFQGPTPSPQLSDAWQKSKPHLLAWVRHHQRPLVVGDSRGSRNAARCKILGVPVARDGGEVIGVLAFFNPPESADFASRYVFLARHLGRQAASIVESQFDLMTGLYTRGGLEQVAGSPADTAGDPDRSLIYIDIDHMHVVNELHGFELGNELIVRIADLLTVPLLPDDALAARVATDRFAVVLRGDPGHGAGVAELIRQSAVHLKIGPPESPLEVSLSCGVAPYLPMPQGLDRALAMAELACKTAKTRGRNRVEIYDFDDDSMMRRHGDVILVGQLRAALKANRLCLHAQRIVPLRGSELPVSYEILVRILDENGEMVMPGPLITAAQRYQLLPSLDRWVTERALQMLSARRSMLASRGLGMSINVSGQSICDAAFMGYFLQQVKAAALPAGCLMVEITEQSALTNLPQAQALVRQLKSHGCKIALDDFGTGSNSLSVLKALDVGRVKIDGSFVRDIQTDRNSRATVRSLVELASGLSIDTVAEYVESAAIAKEVRELGVDYAQGYAFGKPEPLDRLLEQLTNEESQRLHRLFLET